MYDSLLNIELPIILRFGQRKMLLRDIMQVADGSVVDFDRSVDEPVDILVNGSVIARGEVVMVHGNYGVRISGIASHPIRQSDGSAAE